MKRCSKCGIEKETNEFTLNNKTKDKLKCWCKTCVSKKSKEYYSKPQIKEKHKRRNSTLIKNKQCIGHKDRPIVKRMLCQECLDKHMERHNLCIESHMCPNHPSRQAVVGKIRCQECIDYYKAYVRDPNNKMIFLKMATKRRGVEDGIIHNFTLEEWINKVKLSNGFCLKKYSGCGKKKKLTLDHIYPVSKANEDYLKTNIKRIYTIDDVVPLCHSCNSSKRDKIIVD